MAYLYILQSQKSGKYYIGSTNDLVRRLKEHNGGQTKSLRNILPMRLVFNKYCDTLFEARRMERHLKKLKSRDIIEKIVRERCIKTGR